MVLLSPVDGPPQFVQATGDGIRNIYPGHYTIQATGGLAKSYVESIRLGDMEIYGRPFELWDGSQPIHITIRQGGPYIRGNIENAGAATVVVVEADEAVTANPSRSYQPGGSRFDIGPLRPGEYYVFAVDRPAPLNFTPEILRALLARAEKVHLDKDGGAMVTLKAVPWPDSQ